MCLNPRIGPPSRRRWLSDEEAMAQVVEPAKQIVDQPRLQDVTGAFAFESCNDQGEPPYRGRVDMSFRDVRWGRTGEFFEQIAADDGRARLVRRAAPGKASVRHGRSHRHGHGDLRPEPRYRTRGTALQVCGECRNMADHRDDGMTTGVDVTARLSGS